MLLPDWTIDDATPGSIGITPGHSSTPPSLATRFSSSVLQRTSIEIPRPPSREAWTLLELSFGYITRESRQSSSFPILNQPRLTHSARFSGISKSLSYPQDSFESARYFESARLPNATDSRHGFSSIEPQPSTARHSFRASVVVRLQSSRDPPDFCGFVGCDTRASSPCLVVLA